MVKIPDNVDEWTEGLILDILKEGFDENESLEFKETINTETQKIPKTTCAFANSIGGTLIFGVSDDREKLANDRIIGIGKAEDIKKKINDQLHNIKPNIPIEFLIFKKNYIEIKKGKVIVALQVKQSSRSPHQYENIFLKRVNSSNIPMELDDIITKILENQKNKAYMYVLKNQTLMLLDIITAMKCAIDYGDTINIEPEINSIDKSGFQHFLYNRAFIYGAKMAWKMAGLNYELTMLTKDKERFIHLLREGKNSGIIFNNLKKHVENSLRILNELINEFQWDIVLPDNSFTKQSKEFIKKQNKKKLS